MQRWATMGLLAALVGCGPASLGGRVDGAPVGGARDAIWDDVEVDLGPLGDWSYTTVLVSDIPDSCDVLDDLTDVFEIDCEERCEEYLQIVDRYRLVQSSYYVLTLYINTSDGTEGTFSHSKPADEEDEYEASFSRWDVAALSSQETCEEACQDNELFQSDGEEAQGGELELGGVEGDELRGRFTTDFDEEEGLRGSFRAQPCNIAESFLF